MYNTQLETFLAVAAGHRLAKKELLTVQDLYGEKLKIPDDIS